MKIGIITIHNSPNYGACLQAYALYKYISNHGHEVEIINLLRPTHLGYIASNRFRPFRTLQKSAYKMIISRLKSLIINKKKNNNTSPLSKESQIKFEQFNSSIKLSRIFRSIDDLYANPPKYDLYITGSDQVWNPSQSYCIEPYFLSFVPNDKIKISYASSIGISKLSENEKNFFKEKLASYKAISVREYTAKHLLEEIMNRQITQVADPTFLLSYEHWKSLSNNSKYTYTNYIFLFTLTFDKNLFDYATKLSNEEGKSLIFLCANRVPNDCKAYCTLIEDAGPCDFLKLIENANLVLTNSFHCTIFSIIMQTHNFYTYIPEGNQRGSRITDLLSTFSLSSHIITNFNTSFLDLQLNTIDKESVAKIYNNEQKKSIDFLSKFI